MSLVRLPAIAVAFLAAAASGGCGGGDEEGGTPTTSGQSPGLLFVLTAQHGTLKPAGSEGTSALSLDVEGSRGVAFTDRPERAAESFDIRSLVDSWGKLGFADDPPNAALVLNEAPPDADATIYEISDPSLDSETEVLSFTATRVEESKAEALPDHEESRPPAEFGRADLFVDPGEYEGGIEFQGGAVFKFKQAKDDQPAQAP